MVLDLTGEPLGPFFAQFTDTVSSMAFHFLAKNFIALLENPVYKRAKALYYTNSGQIRMSKLEIDDMDELVRDGRAQAGVVGAPSELYMDCGKPSYHFSFQHESFIPFV